MNQEKTQELEAWSAANADWDQYLNLLYPSANNLRWIADRKVVEQLELRGDMLTIAREITHWAYFPSEESRTAFESLVVSFGFKALDKSNAGSSDQQSP